MDMIGRLRENLVLQGIGSSPIWPGIVEQRNAPVGLPITIQGEAFAPTDSTSFYVRGVPILNAFTGAHEEYHTPRDTPDLINYEGAAKISKFMALVARGLATSAEVPKFTEAKRPKNEPTRGGLRAYLGTIPDYAQGDIEGVKLSGVGKGGPAEKAGVQAGDIIVKLAGKEIKNIYDYTYILGAVKIGDEVEMDVMRKGKRVNLKITPGSRE
jgi:C-terminal processing protease CtpA/Prc